MTKYIKPGYLHLFMLVGTLSIYLIISLRNLDVIPVVYEDEPWQASTGWKLAKEGVFGSDLFTGLHKMEERYYGFMPLHPLLLAGFFKFLGVGLLQARLETVFLGWVVLLLTYSLGYRLFGPQIGLLSILFLLVVRLTGLTPSQESGILFLDLARIARYDMLVPVFGLLALHAYLNAQIGNNWLWYGLTGLFVGLAGLSHLYGVFWLGAIGLLMIWDRAKVLAFLGFGFGFLIPWIPYGLYILEDIPSWTQQTQIYAPRFELSNPRWYLNNLIQEPKRYGPGLGPPSWNYLLRPGLWTMTILLPISLIWFTHQAWIRKIRPARVILVPTLVLPFLFGLLLYLKIANYLVTIYPLLGLVAAWGLVTIWNKLVKNSETPWIRYLIALLLVLVAVEGVSRWTTLERAGQTTTPYSQYISEVRSFIPPGSTVLGLHSYWFGLEEFDYRSWVVPLFQSTSAMQEHPLSIRSALDHINPSIVLMDENMRGYFAETIDHDPRIHEIQQWMMENNAHLQAAIEDPDYGTMEIFRISR